MNIKLALSIIIVTISYSISSYAGIEAGFSAMQKKDYKVALKEFRPAASTGSSIAQYAMGYLLENGYGVTKSYSEAFAWYRKSAIQGNAEAIPRCQTSCRLKKFNFEMWRRQWSYDIQKHLSSRRYSRYIRVASGR